MASHRRLGWFLIAAFALAAAPPLAAQAAPAREPPRQAVFLGAGARDGGDLGAPLWVLSAGVHRDIAPSIAGGLAVSHARTGETVCPLGLDGQCIPSPTVSAIDLVAEFRYGTGDIHPYGITSLGLARLRSSDREFRRWGSAYSTGLGLRGRAGAAVWVFADARWRQETFGSVNARGVAGNVGLTLGF